MSDTHVIFVPGTHMPPAAFAGIKLPQGTSAHTLDWMERVHPCRLTSVVSFVTAQAHPERPTILVGHSSGAVIAAMAVLGAPTTFAGLVLINSGPNMNKHRSIDDLLRRLRGPLADADWEEFANSNISTTCAPESIQAMADYSRQIGGDAAATLLSDQAQTNLLESSALADFPVEVLHGSLDKKRGVSDAYAWSQVFPEAHIVLEPACGHTPPLEQPESVADALERICVRIDPARHASALRTSVIEEGPSGIGITPAAGSRAAGLPAATVGPQPSPRR